MQRVQIRNDTSLFRDLDVLRTAKRRLKGRQGQLKILSFGCSVGDEVASLRAIFPDADIVGCDINPAVLDVARRSVGHLGKIILSEEQALRDLGPYDLITACSVLCMNPRPSDFLTAFSPQRFDELLEFIDSLLAPGGLLALVNTSYRFRDSPVFSRYDPVRSDIIWRNTSIDLIGREGTVLMTAMEGGHCIHNGFTVADDEELTESLFEKRVGLEPAVHWISVMPVPDNLTVISSFERGLTDFLGEAVPPNMLRRTFQYDICFDAGSRRRGFRLTRKSASLAHSGEHVRPPIWTPNPAMNE